MESFTMDQVNEYYTSIQSTINALLKTPDTKEHLEALQVSLQADWNKFQKTVKSVRPTLTDQDDLDLLNDLVSRASKTYNITHQGITNKLTKLAKDMENAALAAAAL